MKVVYESGPSGYLLALYLRGHEIDCVVAASPQLLRAPDDKFKTENRDARSLTEMLVLGQVMKFGPHTGAQGLTGFSPPTGPAAKDLAHARQRVNAIILRHAICYPEKTKSTLAHHA